MATRTIGIEILGEVTPQFAEILTPGAMDFVATLVRKFSSRREELLRKRSERQAKFDSGVTPDFLRETEGIRRGDWQVSPVPEDLQDRRVEITGPSGDVKMVINAFNSGANVYMADFEDAQSPTWENTIQGQINLRDAVNGTIGFTSPEGKAYSLNEKTATLMVRPRGWHLLERHVRVDSEYITASLFDFALFLYHNAKKLLEKGSGPYFYLPKMESHLEARLWNDVFVYSEEKLVIPRGSIKATVLIETILGAFEQDEILYELREHSAGLNCGRWDYIFSYIKKFRKSPILVLPDRAQVTMDKAFLAAYVKLAIKTCHRRGIHAIGGMSAYIPVKNDEAANKVAFEKVIADKEREVKAGHDGTWVAHPGLVPVAKKVFDRYMTGPNQVANKRDDVQVTPADLLEVPEGDITEEGVRTNMRVGLQYIAAWFAGRGSVPLYNLMEDAATAEICRAQLWQWLHHGATLKDGRKLNEQLLKSIMKEEVLKVSPKGPLFSDAHIQLAGALLESMTFSGEFQEFLTLPAYEILLRQEARSKN